MTKQLAANSMVVAVCKSLGIPAPEPEYEFAADIGRKWRMDYAWPTKDNGYLTGGGVFLEIQGGLFMTGRHNQGAAMLKEYEKLNTAAIRGYRCIMCSPRQFSSGEALTWVAMALKGGT